jgi:hypothetical protein
MGFKWDDQTQRRIFSQGMFDCRVSREKWRKMMIHMPGDRNLRLKIVYTPKNDIKWSC